MPLSSELFVNVSFSIYLSDDKIFSHSFVVWFHPQPKIGGVRGPRWGWPWSTEDRKGGAVVAAARRLADGGVELSRHRRGRHRRDERRRLRTTTSQPPMLMASRMMRSTSRSPQA